MLSRAITLVESTLPSDQELASALLDALMPYTGKSFRLGLTGVPGVGKSTFIEAFGMHLVANGHKVAVLSIDPTSGISKGSILGDKTRMDTLSKHPSAYIRPSPSGGILGGVALHTRETILLCEAAGYDYLVVETVGVGQGETTVDSLTDFFLLLMLAGAGDELQGIKRGIMELAHAVVITKADGDNQSNALRARAQYTSALHWIAPRTEGWQTEVMTCSALYGEGVPQIAGMLQHFQEIVNTTTQFEKRRVNQRTQWLQDVLYRFGYIWLVSKPSVQAILPALEQSVGNGTLSVTSALLQIKNAAMHQ